MWYALEEYPTRFDYVIGFDNKQRNISCLKNRFAMAIENYIVEDTMLRLCILNVGLLLADRKITATTIMPCAEYFNSVYIY